MNLNQITVPALNVLDSVAFYETMGLKLIVRSDHYARFESPEGDATFSVHKAEAVPETAGITVYFESDQLDDLVSDLIQRGIVFETLPEDKAWLWREARLKDPSGNQIILYKAGKNRKDPPWRIRP